MQQNHTSAPLAEQVQGNAIPATGTQVGIPPRPQVYSRAERQARERNRPKSRPRERPPQRPGEAVSQAQLRKEGWQSRPPEIDVQGLAQALSGAREESQRPEAETTSGTLDTSGPYPTNGYFQGVKTGPKPPSRPFLLIHRDKVPHFVEEPPEGRENGSPEEQAARALKRLGEEELSGQVERYSEARRNALWQTLCERRQREGLGEKIPDDVRRQEACGGHLVFRTAWDPEQGCQHRLHAARFCDQYRSCAVCAIRRSAKLLQAYMPKVLELRKQLACRFTMLTFTVRNGPDLSERYGFLMASYARWLKRWENAHRRGVQGAARMLAKVFGGWGCVEVKLGSGSGVWHPHMHMLLAHEGPLDWAEGVQTWAESSEQSRCWFSPLHSDAEDVPAAEYEDRLAKDLHEVCKYPLKFSGMLPYGVWHFARTMAKKRLIRSFGAFRGVQVDADPLDAPLDWETLSYAERIYAWNQGAGVYDLTACGIVLRGTTPAEKPQETECNA